MSQGSVQVNASSLQSLATNGLFQKNEYDTKNSQVEYHATYAIRTPSSYVLSTHNFNTDSFALPKKYELVYTAANDLSGAENWQ
jgi:DNA-binding HxlR family transcriptional regulator